MNLTEIKPAFRTENLEVFRATCMRKEGGGLPIDVFIGFLNYASDEPLPEPACIVTIRDWDTWVERSKDCEKGTDTDYWNHRTIEWVVVPKEHRRCGIASEAILGIQKYLGPLSDCDEHGWYKHKCDWPECGVRFFDAIGSQLLGDVAGPLTPEEQAEREDWRTF